MSNLSVGRGGVLTGAPAGAKAGPPVAQAARAEKEFAASFPASRGAVRGGKSKGEPVSKRPDAAARQDADGVALDSGATPDAASAPPALVAAVAVPPGVAHVAAGGDAGASDDAAPSLQGDSAKPLIGAKLKPAVAVDASADGAAKEAQVPAATVAGPAIEVRQAEGFGHHAATAEAGDVSTTEAIGGPAGVTPSVAAKSGVSEKTPLSGHAPAAAQEAAAAQPGDPRTLLATPNTLEVGVATATHGWLRLRAELGPEGAVSAALVATSAGAAESLHSSLPALTAYLAAEQPGISSIVVQAPAASAGTYDPAAGGAGSDAGRGQQGGGADGASKVPPGELEVVGFQGLAVAAPAALVGGGAGFSGGWLSVRV